MGAFAALAPPDECVDKAYNGDNGHEQRAKNEVQDRTAAARIFVVLTEEGSDGLLSGLVAGEQAENGVHRAGHGFVPVAFREFGHHDAVLDAAAHHVGKHFLKSFARRNLVAAVLGGQGDDQSVVLLFLADAVFLEQVAVEGVGVVAFQVLHHDADGLHPLHFLKVGEQFVDAVNGLRAKNVVGIAGVVCRLLQVRHGQGLGRPSACHGIGEAEP